MSNQTQMVKDDGLYKMHRLPKDPEKALEAAKNILTSKAKKEPIQAKLRYKVAGTYHNTSLIHLRKPDPTKINILRSELLASDADFEEIILMTSLLKKRRTTCPNCEKEMRSDHFSRHLKSCSKKLCPVCKKAVTGMLGDHMEKCNVRTYSCNVCGEKFNTGIRKSAHEKKCGVVEPGRSALQGLFKIVEMKPSSVTPDYEGVLEDEVDSMIKILDRGMDPAVKFYISMELNMKLPTDDNTKVAFFQTRSTTLLKSMDFKEEVESHIKSLVFKIEKYRENGSGWLVEGVSAINIMITKYNPMTGGTFIPLPKDIKNKTSLLNVRNKDQKCLLWSLLAYLHPAETHSDRVTSYKQFESDLDMSGITYPVHLNQIDKIESQNNLAISIYGWEKGEGFYPLKISEASGEPISLLLLANGYNQHYVLIKSLSGLLSDRTKHNGLMFYCCRCLHGFTKKENLEKHIEHCRKFKVQRTVMSKDSHMAFKGFGKMIMHPIFITADFESNLIETNAGSSSTQKTAKHEACAYALKVSSIFEEYDKPVESYRGPNAARTFILRLHEIFREVKSIIFAEEKMKPLTPEKKAELKVQKDCYLCNKPLPNDRSKIHLDHCHYTGEAIAYTHPICNMKRETPKRIPIIMHNFKGYDSHLLIRDLCAAEDDLSKVGLIPKNMEQYLSIRTKKFFFVDSYQHLSAPLETLVENLKMDGEDKFHSVKRFIDEEHAGSREKFNLLLRKGVYPYEYMDSTKKFEEGLPPIESFFNKLRNESCSQEDYQHVQNMWREFNTENLGDLCDIYVKSDVLLLTDIISEYRRECWENFHLDPLHYDTAPGLTWDAALRWTGVKLEHLKDVDKYLFCECAIRGGVSVISKRKCSCNNKDLPDFDPTKPSNYIWYGDANNLYGGSMVEKLPVSDFVWTSLSQQQIRDYDPESNIGYFVECDLSIPNELHDKFNCFPIAAEPLNITEKIASSKSLEIRAKRKPQAEVPEELQDTALPGDKRELPFNNPPAKKIKTDLKFSCIKLAPNLLPKSKHICHTRNLKFYVEEGVQIDAIYRVLQFKQEAWLKPYIEYNTKKRQQSNTDFKKAFHKLLNNAVFGKTMESVRRRVNVVLINKARQQNFQTSKPGFKRFSIFSEDLVGVQLVKPIVELNKPVYVGAAILELSKNTMMSFWYRVFKPTFPKATLCFTDTDSLLVDVPTDDLYRDLSTITEHLDLSNYPKDHPLYDPSNKAVLNKFKDECSGNVVKEFIGLRSKCYSILVHENGKYKQKSTAAGVKKSVKKSLHHELYKQTLESETDIYISQGLLRSYKHEIFSITQKKLALTAYDDKRHLLNDGIHTKAYGHYLNE